MCVCTGAIVYKEGRWVCGLWSGLLEEYLQLSLFRARIQINY